MLWFQPCPLPWEAGEKVRGAPALACVPTHPPSHRLTGSCKIHHFPSTHPGGNNDNKNKIRTTPFPRLGGWEGNELLGTAWISQPLLANVTFQRESRRHRLLLCVCRNRVLSQPFPCHWILSEGLRSCHVPCERSRFASPAAGSAFPASLASFKETPQSPDNVKLEIFSFYLMLHYCDCSLLIDRAAFANAQDPWRIARCVPSPALARRRCSHRAWWSCVCSGTGGDISPASPKGWRGDLEMVSLPESLAQSWSLGKAVPHVAQTSMRMQKASRALLIKGFALCTKGRLWLKDRRTEAHHYISDISPGRIFDKKKKKYCLKNVPASSKALPWGTFSCWPRMAAAFQPCSQGHHHISHFPRANSFSHSELLATHANPIKHSAMVRAC